MSNNFNKWLKEIKKLFFLDNAAVLAYITTKTILRSLLTVSCLIMALFSKFHNHIC